MRRAIYPLRIFPVFAITIIISISVLLVLVPPYCALRASWPLRQLRLQQSNANESSSNSSFEEISLDNTMPIPAPAYSSSSKNLRNSIWRSVVEKEEESSSSNNVEEEEEEDEKEYFDHWDPEHLKRLQWQLATLVEFVRETLENSGYNDTAAGGDGRNSPPHQDKSSSLLSGMQLRSGVDFDAAAEGHVGCEPAQSHIRCGVRGLADLCVDFPLIGRQCLGGSVGTYATMSFTGPSAAVNATLYLSSFIALKTPIIGQIGPVEVGKQLTDLFVEGAARIFRFGLKLLFTGVNISPMFSSLSYTYNETSGGRGEMRMCLSVGFTISLLTIRRELELHLLCLHPVFEDDSISKEGEDSHPADGVLRSAHYSWMVPSEGKRRQNNAWKAWADYTDFGYSFYYGYYADDNAMADEDVDDDYSLEFHEIDNSAHQFLIAPSLRNVYDYYDSHSTSSSSTSSSEKEKKEGSSSSYSEEADDYSYDYYGGDYEDWPYNLHHIHGNHYHFRAGFLDGLVNFNHTCQLQTAEINPTSSSAMASDTTDAEQPERGIHCCAHLFIDVYLMHGDIRPCLRLHFTGPPMRQSAMLEVNAVVGGHVHVGPLVDSGYGSFDVVLVSGMVVEDGRVIWPRFPARISLGLVELRSRAVINEVDFNSTRLHFCLAYEVDIHLTTFKVVRLSHSLFCLTPVFGTEMPPSPLSASLFFNE